MGTAPPGLAQHGIHIPIVALTANAERDSEKCLEAGCDGYLSAIDREQLFTGFWQNTFP